MGIEDKLQKLEEAIIEQCRYASEGKIDGMKEQTSKKKIIKKEIIEQYSKLLEILKNELSAIGWRLNNGIADPSQPERRWLDFRDRKIKEVLEEVEDDDPGQS